MFDGQPIELLQGELIEISPEGLPHAGLSSDAADYLRELLGGRAKIREGKPITLSNHSEPEPDIAIVRPLGSLYKTQRHPQAKDLTLKTRLYAEAAILEYWVVNLRTRALIVFRDPEGAGYRSQSILTQGTLHSLAFPEIPIEVSQVLV